MIEIVKGSELPSLAFTYQDSSGSVLALASGWSGSASVYLAGSTTASFTTTDVNLTSTAPNVTIDLANSGEANDLTPGLYVLVVTLTRSSDSAQRVYHHDLRVVGLTAATVTNGYCTLEELRRRLTIPDTVDDVELSRAIMSASRAIDSYCRRSFVDAGSATARTYPVTDAWCLTVDDFSTTTGLVVKTDDNDDGTFETTWASTDYELDPPGGVVDGRSGWPYWHLRAVGDYSFPTGTRRRYVVQVTARWGWTAVPAEVKEACLMVGANLYKRRDAPLDVAGFGEFGTVRVPPSVLRGAVDLLTTYRRGDRWGLA